MYCIAEIAILLKILSSKRRRIVLFSHFFIEIFQRTQIMITLNTFLPLGEVTFYFMDHTQYGDKDMNISGVSQMLQENAIPPRFAKKQWIQQFLPSQQRKIPIKPNVFLHQTTGEYVVFRDYRNLFFSVIIEWVQQ